MIAVDILYCATVVKRNLIVVARLGEPEIYLSSKIRHIPEIYNKINTTV